MYVLCAIYNRCDDGHLDHGVEAGVWLLVLHEVLEGPEHQRAQEHEGEQQPQVLVARLHRVGDGLETHRPLGQLEDPHDSGDSEHLHDPAHCAECIFLLFFLVNVLSCVLTKCVWNCKICRRHEEEVDVVRSDGESIDNVHGSLHEGHFAWRRGETEEEFQREETDAESLEKRHLGVVHGVAVSVLHQHPGEGVEAHAAEGDEHHGHREEGHHLGGQTRLRLLQEVPQRALVRHEVAAPEVLGLLLLLLLVELRDVAEYCLSPGDQLVLAVGASILTSIL